MPCLNECRTVRLCVEKAIESLRQADVSGEIIVSDNGSRDESPVIARKAGARVVHCNVAGYGAAVRFGVHNAFGECIIIGDADGSYDFSNIGDFIDFVSQGADLVLGNRFSGGIQDGAMPLMNRYIGNPALTWLVNHIYKCNIGDAECGLRSFSRTAFEQMNLQCDGMEFASEMVAKAARSGMIIREIPIRYYPDGRDRPPHLRPLRDGLRNLKFLLADYIKTTFCGSEDELNDKAVPAARRRG